MLPHSLKKATEAPHSFVVPASRDLVMLGAGLACILEDCYVSLRATGVEALLSSSDSQTSFFRGRRGLGIRSFCAFEVTDDEMRLEIHHSPGCHGAAAGLAKQMVSHWKRLNTCADVVGYAFPADSKISGNTAVVDLEAYLAVTVVDTGADIADAAHVTFQTSDSDGQNAVSDCCATGELASARSLFVLLACRMVPQLKDTGTEMEPDIHGWSASNLVFAPEMDIDLLHSEPESVEAPDPDMRPVATTQQKVVHTKVVSMAGTLFESREISSAPPLSPPAYHSSSA